MAIHEAAGVGFARSADAYDRARPAYPSAAIDRFWELLGLAPGATVVDVGAGTGKLTAPLVARGATVRAVEPVAEMRERLAESAPEATALAGVAEKLPVDDGWAAAVIAGQAFHWFANERALAEFDRCLRPGGRLGLIWNRRLASDPLQARISELLEPLRGDAPRHAAGAWRAAFEDSPIFEPAVGFELEFVQELDADGLVDRVGSISFVAALEPRRRDAVLARVADLAPPAAPARLAYVCEAFVYRRRPLRETVHRPPSG